MSLALIGARASTCALLLSLICLQPASAQPPESLTADSTLTVFPQHDAGRFAFSGQANVIAQGHPAFPAIYSGTNSLSPEADHATSRLFTLSTMFRATDRTDIQVDIESAGGGGIGDALGLAGFTNLDVVRNPSLGAAPYLARLLFHQKAGTHFEFALGKLSTADFFDRNGVGSDSHLQFTNWTVDNNGAYDYAADTRGYTWGGVAQYHRAHTAVRFGEMLMPKVANGLELDWTISRARAENLEFEIQRGAPRHDATVVRVLSYVNHANMGDYREAVRLAQATPGARPAIEQTRQQGRVKYGLGLNAEQHLGALARAYARWGMNEPHFESFAYTEVNDSAAVGGDYNGQRWSRPHDRIGVAIVSNGISAEHRQYLAMGGLGFLLGDGALRYGREAIVETYYTLHVWRGVFGGADVQHIAHPGYNRDRGPVTVLGLRLHVDL